MYSKYVLGVSCVLAPVGGAQAQTATPARPAQPPAPAPPALPDPPALYQMSSASQALNLTPDQINRLNQAAQETQARYRHAYNQLGSLNGAARTARLRDLNQQYALDWNV